MKKILLLAISLFFIALSSAAQQTTITKFEGQTIKGLIVDGAFDVKLVQGQQSGVSVSVSTEASEKLTIELTDQGYLRLGYGSDLGKYFTSQKNRPTARITVSELNYLNVSGVSNLIGSETFTSSVPFVMQVAKTAFCSFIKIETKDSNIAISGTATVENLTVKDQGKMTLEVAGGSKAELQGTAKEARISVSGASSLNALQFICPAIQISSTGTSMSKINITGTADVTTAALGAIRYIGQGKITGSGAKPL